MLALALALTGCSSGGAASSGGQPTSSLTNTSKDTQINTEVQQALSSDPALKGDKITVTTKDAQVILEGTVKSVQERDAAEKDVDAVIQKYSSVNAGVINNLLVGEDNAKSGIGPSAP